MANNPFADIGAENPFAGLPADKANDGEFEFGEMGSNIGGSAWNAAVDTVSALKLWETIPALYGMGPEGVFNAMVDHYATRYGSVDEALNTIEQDPVGAALDFSGVGALVRNAPIKALKVAGNAAQVLDPVRVPGNAARQAVKTGAGQLAPGEMYEQALKPPTTMPTHKRQQAVDTALEEQLMPTKGGVTELQKRVNQLDSELDRYISEATLRGVEVPADQVLGKLDELRRTKGGYRRGALEDLEAIDLARSDFTDMIEATGRNWVTPQELQAFKQDLYRQVNYDRPRGSKPMIQEDINKALASGAREIVAEAIPQASEINRRLGNLLNLEKPLERAAGRISNRNILGPDTTWKANLGANVDQLLGTPGIFSLAGGGMGVLETPLIKSKVALVIKKMQDQDVKWLQARSHWPEIRYMMWGVGKQDDDSRVEEKE